MGKSNTHRTKQTVSRSWRPGRIVLSFFFILILLLSCLPFLLPKLINNDYIRHKALGLIGQDLGRHMDVDHIAMTFFPRPGFRLDGLTLHPDDTITIGVKSAFLFPDISTLLSRNPFPLTGELIMKQISLVSAAPPAKALPLPLQFFNGSTLKSLAMHFSYTSVEHFALTIRGSHLRISPEAHPEHTLYARSLSAEIKKTQKMLSIHLDPIGFDPPDMLLGVRFLRDNTLHTSQLNFTGHNVSVSPLRAISSIFLKKSAIASTLFHIVRKGTIPHITVDFQNDEDKFLFDPQKMTINAELQGGTIAIPATPLIATDVTAMVQVKNGILSPQISQGTVEAARLNQGTLQVNLLDKNHAFKGKFFLKANLEKLPGVLKSLLPDTPLSRELDLTEKIAGSATGILELTRSCGKTLEVAVHCKNIDVTGSYQRFPGNTFQLEAKAFSFDKGKITLKGMKGTIGPCQISQTSGGVNLKSPHFFNITSGPGIFPMQSTLAWLTQFHPMRPLVAPLSTSRGELSLDHLTLKGALSAPTQWDYAVQGTFARGSLYQEPGEKGISDISFSFDLSPHVFALKKFTATIHNTDLVINNCHTNGFPIPQQQLLRDFQPPITLSNVTLGKTDQDLSFQCQATFPRGIFMAMTGTHSNQHTILEKLEIKHPPLSRAEISHPPGSPLTFKGKLNIKTIKQLFKQNSATAAALALGENTGKCLLASGPGEGITLSLDHLDMKTLLAFTDIKDAKTLPSKADLNIPGNGDLHAQKNAAKSHPALTTKDKCMIPKEDHGALIPNVDMIPRPMHINVGTFGFNRFLISPLALEVFFLPTGTDVEIQESGCCGLPITGGHTQRSKNTEVNPGNRCPKPGFFHNPWVFHKRSSSH